jgi:hypothetical protein
MGSPDISIYFAPSKAIARLIDAETATPQLSLNEWPCLMFPIEGFRVKRF